MFRFPRGNGGPSPERATVPHPESIPRTPRGVTGSQCRRRFCSTAPPEIVRTDPLPLIKGRPFRFVGVARLTRRWWASRITPWGVRQKSPGRAWHTGHRNEAIAIKRWASSGSIAVFISVTEGGSSARDNWLTARRWTSSSAKVELDRNAVKRRLPLGAAFLCPLPDGISQR